MRTTRPSWIRPWYAAFDGLLEWLRVVAAAIFLVFFIVFFIAVSIDEAERKTRCERAGGVWLVAYRTSGKCLKGEGLHEIDP